MEMIRDFPDPPNPVGGKIRYDVGDFEPPSVAHTRCAVWTSVSHLPSITSCAGTGLSAAAPVLISAHMVEHPLLVHTNSHQHVAHEPDDKGE